MEKQTYKFSLTPLPYEYSALEPYIDTLTMQLHHDKHLGTYVNNLNAALKDYPQYHSWTPERLVKDYNWLPQEIKTTVKNNAGGVYNHTFFFENLSNPGRELPEGQLKDKIDSTFGSFESFKKEFKKSALGVFGSGYAWLVTDSEKSLRIITTANQDTPVALGMYPVMCLDVWEHAYYLKHYNVRADYIDDWFNVVNMRRAEENYIA